jgi:hypothetical protein
VDRFLQRHAAARVSDFVIPSAGFFGDCAVVLSKRSVIASDARAGTNASYPFADELRDAVRRRSTSLQARWRVAEAIRALALDICGEEYLSADDAAELRQRILGPVNEATEEALNVLIAELTEAMRGVPPRMRPSITASPPIRRTDFE